MKIEQHTLVMSKAEFDQELAQLGLAPNALGWKPETASAKTPTAGGDPLLRKELRDLLAGLVQPRQIARMHYSLAEESVSRLLLAWPARSVGDLDPVVSLKVIGEERWIKQQTEGELRRFAGSVVASDQIPRPLNLGFKLSSLALITLLALVDHARQMRLRAALEHTLPRFGFSIDELEARVADTQNQDFRWLLLFTAPLLPFAVADSIKRADLEHGVEELMANGLVAPLDDSGKARVYQPSKPGEQLLLDLVHEVAKLGISFSAMRPDGQIGHETLVFVRTPQHLYLIDIGGQGGALAALDSEAFEGVLRQVFAPSRAVAPVNRVAEHPTKAKSKPRSKQQAASAKQAVAQFCGECGAKLDADARFCTGCGAKVE